MLSTIQGTTDVYLISGAPVEQVRAPEVFNLIFRTLGINAVLVPEDQDRKSTRLNSSHSQISYAVFCLKKKTLSLHDALPIRSEEHTSELQSQSNLVCRLLLEKKKTIPERNTATPTEGVQRGTEMELA